MQTFPIAGLDFNQIKKNFIDFVKSDPNAPYTDFDFEGSGINALLNIFAYNAHYLGFYVKMLLNESFVDSALKRESLISRGKLNAYVAAGVKTSRAKIKIKLRVDEEENYGQTCLVLDRGYSFTGRNYLEDCRRFVVLDNVTATPAPNNPVGKIEYISPEFNIYEGFFREWRFEVESNVLAQRFFIQERNVDINTLRVFVHPNSSSDDREEYVLATNFIELSGESKVYFITTSESGHFEIFFGNNIFGKKPENSNMIVASYLISSGSSGNGCRTFSDPDRMVVGSFGISFNDDDYTIETIENSHGGLEEESVEELRFNIPHHYRRQNRMVTEGDYKSLLKEKFRNIDSINVWGGEKHFFKDYGSLYICIKPKNGLLLTQTAKSEIEKYLKDYSVIGMQVKVVQPEYTWLDLTISVKYDKTLTSMGTEQIKNILISETINFDEIYLDNFNQGLSDIDFLNYIKRDKSYITRIFDTKRLIKKLIFIPNTSTENLLLFGNAIIPGSLHSSELVYGNIKVLMIDDSQGKIWLIDYEGNKIINNAIGTVDYSLGLIKIIINFDLDLTNNTDEIVDIIVTPSYPDIESYLHNIIKINQIEVII